jgi:hypothetical protein
VGDRKRVDLEPQHHYPRRDGLHTYGVAFGRLTGWTYLYIGKHGNALDMQNCGVESLISV